MRAQQLAMPYIREAILGIAKRYVMLYISKLAG